MDNETVLVSGYVLGLLKHDRVSLTPNSGTPLMWPRVNLSHETVMPKYRLRYLDPLRKFIRADVIEGHSDDEAIISARARQMAVRSELWDRGRLVAKFRPPRAERPQI
jgi:hypothetical protein